MTPRVVACLASFAGREHTLRAAVATLAPQVDAVHLFWNGPGPVPRRLPGPVVIQTAEAHGDQGDAGKLWWLRKDLLEGDTVVLLCDDDLAYPVKYTAYMLAHLMRLEVAHDEQEHVVISVHGSRLVPNPQGYRGFWTRRWQCLDERGWAETEPAHVLGTGVMALRVSAFREMQAEAVKQGHRPRWLEPRNKADLHLALLGQVAHLPFYVVPRPRGRWLEYLLPADADTIWTRRNTDDENALVRSWKDWTLWGGQG